MKQRNKCLDSFKGIACLLVVFLHVRLPFEFVDGIIQSASRFAIPLFFMVSGYFSCYSDCETLVIKLPKKILHILKLCVAASCYWILMQLAVQLLGSGNHDLIAEIKSWFTVKSLVNWIVFNADPFINILWFLFALLYTYCIVYIFAKLNKVDWLLYITPLLLVVHFSLGNIAYAFGINIGSQIFRNCWLMGLPLFMIGYLIKKADFKLKISSNAARNLIFVGLILSIAEWLLIGGRQQMYIGSIIVAISMIIYSEHNPDKVFTNCIYTIGNKYSLFIYIVHISIGIVLDKIIKIVYSAESNVYLCIKPFLVMVGSVLAAMMFYKFTVLVFNREDEKQI